MKNPFRCTRKPSVERLAFCVLRGVFHAKRKTLNAQRPSGFTLLEVLVALTITAIVLIAGLKATSSLTDNAARQRQVLLADICAQNQLIALRLARVLPGVGDSTSTCTQAGVVMQVQQSVRPTPNPSFRRVNASVSEDGVRILTLTTIVGRE